jgi:hypothetical protein
MDIFNSLLGTLLNWYSRAFSSAPPSARLAVLALYAAVAMLWVLKKTSNPQRIRCVKRLLQAHLLEMRIFRDEPAVVWRAQKSLLAYNAIYLGLMLRPALFMALPFTLVLAHLDAYYGRTPLPLEQEAIVTMTMRSLTDPSVSAPVLEAPPGIVVETPPVRVFNENQVSWRIRPHLPVTGVLRFLVDGQTIEKKIVAGSGSGFVPGLRPSSLLGTLLHPDEPRIRSAIVESIEIRYPATDLEVFGLRMHWLVWFTLFSMLLALLLRKRFGVVL